MSRTFTPLVGAVGHEPYMVGDKFGYQTAEKLRQAVDISLYMLGPLDLGGSDSEGLVTAGTFLPAIGYRDYTLKGDNLGGLTTQAVIYARTDDLATSVQVRIRDTTHGATAGAGSVISSLTLVKEILTLSLDDDASDYRLELLGGNSNAAVYAYGYLLIHKVPT